MKHYAAGYEALYLYYSNGNPIFINEINKRSNELGQLYNKTNRDILILEYDPTRTTIFVTD